MSELRIEKELLLESLSETDRLNLGNVATAFLEYLSTKKLTGALLVVGGVVIPEKMGTRRKDIDIKPIISRETSFETFRDLVEYFSIQTGFEISRIIEPKIDPHFDWPPLEIDTGNMELKPPEGTPIDVIRNKWGTDWRDAIIEEKQDGLYYSVLVNSKE